MERFLKKYSWVLHLIVIAIVSSLTAWSINKAVAIQLAPFTAPEVTSFESEAPKKPRSRAAARNTNFSSTIKNRCLFGCPETVSENECPDGCEDGEVCQEGKCVPPEPEASADSSVMTESDLNIKLMGAMVSNKSQYSLALLQENKSTFIVGVGEVIGEDGGAEIVEIRRDRVIIRRSGRLEYIRIVGSIGGAPSATPSLAARPAISSPTDLTGARRTPKIEPARARAAEGEQEGVKKTGENKYEIERSAIADQLSDPQVLAKQARIVPNFKGNKTDGIKLIGVSPGSVYSKIGIQTGDIVHSINGKKITSQARALELLEQMRSENNVRIEVERKGNKELFEYSVK